MSGIAGNLSSARQRRHVRHRRLSLLLTTSLVLLPRAAAADNLFPRGEFDQANAIDGWDFTQGVGDVTFLSLVDADDCALSGAAMVTEEDDFAGGFFRESVCGGAIAGEVAYRFGFRARFPTQPATGSFLMRIGWYPGPDCASLAVQVDEVPAVASTPAGVWQASSFGSLAPANAVSFRIGIELDKTSVAPLSVEIDGLFLRFKDELYSDDFEISESCRWSQAVP
jgi:hypothetical protein